jgi:hypothetical protein
VEQTIADIWRELLGLDRVGIHDSFFELGGHSLLFMQVISRMRNSFHVAVSLHRFFETPTVAGLALTIAQGQSETVESDAMEGLLAELEGYSDEEVQRLLADEMCDRRDDLPSILPQLTYRPPAPLHLYRRQMGDSGYTCIRIDETSRP